ncbi:hypothetical protein FOIG_04782 [Fusarium odoratissimum NRRL 54006]|uniref:Uncharacterized protein n=2 Tax=Fusarium oxysporum species complex TaxID=171631 RepID=X0JTG4_FUSO5|nr:uncharacterized protein FOIG_04782 [Fusarium odoratissimum NRRL 54006]EXM04584.1 hypothetical protein FOIG_04782 [Fusarium odoratissimum NRRL 54006]TXB99006.1 hypothetical protein FocTR4_00012503 [Fusarium oxysporum f. sp. cubense]
MHAASETGNILAGCLLQRCRPTRLPADPWAVLFVMTARSVAVGHGRTTKCGCISSVAVLVTNRTVPLSRFATCQQIGLVGLTWRWQKPHDLYRQLARRSGMIDIEPTEKGEWWKQD